jgi:ribosome recycling factor
MNNIINDMNQVIEKFNKDISKLRTGRANPSVLDEVKFSYYGTETPVSQVGSISVPEARQILLKPYDKGTLLDIEKAINKMNLGMSIQNDGEQLRLTTPELTKESRQEMVKELKKIQENAKVAARNVRREYNDLAKKMKNNGELTEDSLKLETEKVQKSTDETIVKIDQITKSKEQELLSI